MFNCLILVYIPALLQFHVEFLKLIETLKHAFQKSHQKSHQTLKHAFKKSDQMYVDCFCCVFILHNSFTLF